MHALNTDELVRTLYSFGSATTDRKQSDELALYDVTRCVVGSVPGPTVAGVERCEA
jgi:hypothetical protein